MRKWFSLFLPSFFSLLSLHGFFLASFSSLSSIFFLFILTFTLWFLLLMFVLHQLGIRANLVVFLNNCPIHHLESPANPTPWQVSRPHCHYPQSQTPLLLSIVHFETQALPYNPNHDCFWKRKRNFQNTTTQHHPSGQPMAGKTQTPATTLPKTPVRLNTQSTKHSSKKTHKNPLHHVTPPEATEYVIDTPRPKPTSVHCHHPNPPLYHSSTACSAHEFNILGLDPRFSEYMFQPTRF